MRLRVFLVRNEAGEQLIFVGQHIIFGGERDFKLQRLSFGIFSLNRLLNAEADVDNTYLGK